MLLALVFIVAFIIFFVLLMRAIIKSKSIILPSIGVPVFLVLSVVFLCLPASEFSLMPKSPARPPNFSFPYFMMTTSFTPKKGTKPPVVVPSPDRNQATSMSSSASNSAGSSSQGASVASSADEITASDLLLAYFKDPDIADYFYKGKQLEVTGTIEASGMGASGPYVTMNSDDRRYYSSVQFNISPDKTQMALWSALTKGHTVTIKGTCKGGAQNILLENCQIQD